MLFITLRSKYTGKTAFFIILIGSLNLQESVVQRKKFEKNSYPERAQKPKNLEKFSFQMLKTPQDFVTIFSILAVYVTNSSARASGIFEKTLIFFI